MLFTVVKPYTPGIYWLDRVVTTFYQNLFAGHVFANEMFPTEFAHVLNESPETLRLFREVHIAYTALGLNARLDFQNIYNNHRDLIDHLGNEDYQVNRINNELLTIWARAKALGAILYKSTINQVCYREIPRVTDNMNDHFELFRSLNGSVCFFCGIGPYEAERVINVENGEVQWRADYDHYLYKKVYPFNAVNFDNLFPCCHTCNKKAKKEKDIVRIENLRVTAFHPYIDTDVAMVNVTYSANERRFAVSLPDGDTLLCKKIQNWERIYLITSRVQKIINDSFEYEWFAPISYGKTNAIDIRGALQNITNKCNTRINIERMAYYKAKCFQAILQSTDEDLEILAATVNEIFAGREI